MTQWKLVPTEPTEEILTFICTCDTRRDVTMSTEQTYKAMLAAAPQPPSEPVAWAALLGGYAHIEWGSKRPDDCLHNTPLFTHIPITVPEEEVSWIIDRLRDKAIDKSCIEYKAANLIERLTGRRL